MEQKYYFIELFDRNKWHYVEHTSDQKYAIGMAKGIDKWGEGHFPVRVVHRYFTGYENQEHAMFLGVNW